MQHLGRSVGMRKCCDKQARHNVKSCRGQTCCVESQWQDVQMGLLREDPLYKEQCSYSSMQIHMSLVCPLCCFADHPASDNIVSAGRRRAH